MRKQLTFLFFLLAFAGKLAFTAGSLQALVQPGEVAHTSHSSELTSYYPLSLPEQGVEMEADLSDKLKKQWLSTDNVLPPACLVFVLPQLTASSLVSGRPANLNSRDLVVLYQQFLI